MTRKSQIIIAGLSGLTAVTFGAFGTHGLKNIVDPVMLDTFRTGVFYHLIHSVVLLVLGLHNVNVFTKAYYFFLIGIILFSFSLYIYVLTQTHVFTILTPFGGMSFVIGWLLLIYAAVKEL